jgi:phosphorylcholine metabolism protein LicD
MKSVHSQKGMSLLSWLVVLGLVAFFASAAFKVLPHYFDNMALEKLITSVETDKAANIRSINEFYSHVSKGMQVNSIRDLNLQEALKVKMENNEFRAHLKYEKREPLIENIDLVVRFDKEFRVRMP